jgi:hypothetical protein
MNIPWKVSEQQSTQVGGTQNPVPGSFTTPGEDVRGYDWIEYTVLIENNIGGTPVTQLDAIVEYSEAAGDLAGQWFTLTSEDVDVSGLAPQVDWQPQRAVSGTTVKWRVPVPVHGPLMRLNLTTNGTPDPTSTLKVYAYRRSF